MNLAVICSRNPTETLLVVIRELNKFYPDFDIAIIDSDSDQLDTYEIVKKEHPDVKIHFVKNRNYEFGAFNTAHNLYPNYSTYMFMQDNITPINRLPIENMNEDDVYFIPHDSGFQSGGAQHARHLFAFTEKALKDTKYFDTYLQLKDSRFSICTCNFFVAKNSTVKNLLKNLRVLPQDKMGSCSYERILAIFFLKEGYNMIRVGWSDHEELAELNRQWSENPDMILYFHKKHFRRD